MSIVTEWISGRVFQAVHGRSLVYNCCWEDPRLDREALALRPHDVLLMITSAGCNALDYALLGIEAIHAVDMNFRQNALLELKIAAIGQFDFDDFFAIFGQGRHPRFPHLYQQNLRAHLTPQARAYWDTRTHYFSGQGRFGSFYFRGTSGLFARAIKSYIDRKPRVRAAIDNLFAATSLADQASIYDSIRGVFWSKFIRWLLRRDSTLALLGVPRAQRDQLENQYRGGVVQFIEDCVETVFAKLPLHDNYFWRLYVYGQYTRECCPEYLQETSFEALKSGLVDSIRPYTATITDFLRQHSAKVSRFVLLDHMDWLSTPARQPMLQNEWQAIVDRATDDARILWRSAGLNGRFVDRLQVRVEGQPRVVGDLLDYDLPLAKALHARDRVHTYGSFCIADFRPHAPLVNRVGS